MTRVEESTEAGRSPVTRRSKSEKRMNLFHSRLRDRGLKSTGQRDDIARVFFDLSRHVSAEELYAEVRKVNPHVGYATIYRTLKLLKECDLLYERHFDESQARYEVVGEHHHDHFICDRCGKIIEFENDEIEELQQRIASDMGVTLTHHKMELYGICADCRTRQ